MSAVPAAASGHEPREAYDGPAVLVVADAEHPVSVTLRGAFQPLDGHFHWYGRIAVDAALDEVRSGSAVTLRTPHGEAGGKVADVDPWGRFRVSGTGRPPF
ncbi:DUF4873 domain-containing protein [Nocardioides nitrophenolicus]|uniref:DUF4873 domain-containing protein n=1 Tax=Nocardioides nitrophenolicus TaxID=60489 RepID=UPI0019561367|nr:DUF4873 domain-containing protein [Nocardioides nitrophenolicus]MBM7519233.1 hypothetical protein [Nocardioides nitrophenolicus]